MEDIFFIKKTGGIPKDAPVFFICEMNKTVRMGAMEKSGKADDNSINKANTFTDIVKKGIIFLSEIEISLSKIV